MDVGQGQENGSWTVLPIFWWGQKFSQNCNSFHNPIGLSWVPRFFCPKYWPQTSRTFQTRVGNPMSQRERAAKWHDNSSKFFCVLRQVLQMPTASPTDMGTKEMKLASVQSFIFTNFSDLHSFGSIDYRLAESVILRGNPFKDFLNRPSTILKFLWL